MLEFPPWKVILVSLIVLGGVLLALPNVMRTPSPLPQNQLNLGLDLQGGVYLLIEVRPDEGTTTRLDDLENEILDVLGDLDRPGRRIFYNDDETGIENGRLIVTLRDAGQTELAEDRIEEFGLENAGLDGRSEYRVKTLEPGQLEVRLRGVDSADTSLISDTIEVVRRRVDPDGVREIQLTPVGDDRIALEVPGAPDPQPIKDILSEAGVLSFHLVDPNWQSSVPLALQTTPATVPNGYLLIPAMEYGYPNPAAAPGEPQFLLMVQDKEIMTGDEVRSASQGLDPETGEPVVNFRLNSKGTREFGDVTLQYEGQLFAIVLDKVVMSAPRINEPILGGSGQITIGEAFDEETGEPSRAAGIEEAEDLAAIINSGKLRAELLFREERTVGPGLGADSIRAGTVASIIGLILVAVFMIAVYGLFGVFAVTSLTVNIALIFGVLSWVGATLTLPGIAGIILTIGMAVDANVLVFERVREEQRSGRSPFSAMQKGYESAASTILDANITTLIAALVLYQFGSGPVKGFAVTLAVGIFSSVFTAFVVTRMFSVGWLKWKRPKRLPI